MNRPAHIIIISILVSWNFNSIPYVVEATQLIRLTTASATFEVGINYGHVLSTYEQFKFESSTSKFLHKKLSGYYAASRDIDFSRSRVVATSVHVERMMTSTKVANTKENATSSSSMSLKSIVSVTFSDVGLYKALKVAPITGGLEAKVAPDVAAHLTEIVSSADVMRVLMDEQLITNYDNSTEIELSFVKFDGSMDERGMTATETEILSSGKINDGWPMFFAGMMFAFLAVTIATVAAWIYKKEFPFVLSDGQRSGKYVEEEDAACKSVHYKQGDDDDVATTASGILGTKGMHPRATFDENDENAHPNNGGGSAYRRKKRYGNSSSSSQTEDDTEDGSIRDDDAGCCSPRTPSGVVATSTRRFPLGITSMRRLDSVRTPQKLESDRRPMYDIDRFTRS